MTDPMTDSPSRPRWMEKVPEGKPTNLNEVLWRCEGRVERVIAWAEPDRSTPGKVLTERNRCILDRDHEGEHHDR